MLVSRVFCRKVPSISQTRIVSSELRAAVSLHIHQLRGYHHHSARDSEGNAHHGHHHHHTGHRHQHEHSQQAHEAAQRTLVLDAETEHVRAFDNVVHFACPLCLNAPPPPRTVPSSSASSRRSDDGKDDADNISALSLDALADHMEKAHVFPNVAAAYAASLSVGGDSALQPPPSPPSLSKHSRVSNYPFTEPHQRRGQADYQRANTLMAARLLRRHYHLTATKAVQSPQYTPHIVLLLDIANMERNTIDLLYSLPPLTGPDRTALALAGLIAQRPFDPPRKEEEGEGKGLLSSAAQKANSPARHAAYRDDASPPHDDLSLSLPCTSVDEASFRRHILRVVFSAHPFTLVAMLEDSIVPNCRMMKAIAALASLHPDSKMEILWVGAGDEAGDYASSALIAEVRRAEREVNLARFDKALHTPPPPTVAADVDPCFRQRRVAQGMARNVAADGGTNIVFESAPIPFVLMSDDQIQRASMTRVFGVEGFGFSHTYSVVDLAHALRNMYWRLDDAFCCGVFGCANRSRWSETEWLLHYLSMR